ncbi:hypothetical protein GCM10027277_19320 [Pseudoduganella ginsengisoli]|uniref:Right handed beta helix domain-containing protein n=1 Tax=Pseudoduganella ginsengisoli TaxID=1462440 RepID=A0A6L6PUA0_9BURK|nr:right-handed parallel beta-helix repeat-containing protein [Pseudoduganella ginsengisoli]MTW00811.1 hypothetical protein [Pseudoduganella ginsengisoli]
MHILNKLSRKLPWFPLILLCHNALAVEVCPGQQADATGAAPAAAAIQACINQAGAGGTLELPKGTYLLDQQLKITFPFTLRTQGLAGVHATCTLDTECATLKAAPGFSAPHGLVSVGADDQHVNHVTLDHVTLDGNRAARLTGTAHEQCLKGGHGNAYGFNARMKNCTNCTMTYSASMNALCGTGMEWWGDHATIENNAFINNGNRRIVLEWADGLSMHLSNHTVVRGNRFTDNSDIGLIFFGSSHSVVENNVIRQEKMPAFAGLMLDSLDTGDFTDTTVSGNIIDCAPGMCDFGVNIGPRPWYPENLELVGGTVTGNTVRGGLIGMNVAGIRKTGQAMYIGGNFFEGKWNKAAVKCFKPILSVVSVPLSRDPKFAPVKWGRNFQNNVEINPLVQSTDHCIN